MADRERQGDDLAPHDAALHRLRDRELHASAIERAARDPRLGRHPQIRRAIVLHPRTPLSVSRELLPHLGWRDLSEAAADSRLHPVIRRTAEKLLVGRIGELALGERVALARRVTRPVARALLESTADAPVLLGALGNPRLASCDAIRVAADERTPAEVLLHLADHGRWGALREVRLALAVNPRTPIATALGVVRTLHERDLRRLARDGRVPAIVRVGAQRRLGAVSRRPGSGGARPSGRE